MGEIQMSIYSLGYSMRQVFVSLRRNLGLALITSVMIAISLIAVGGFLLVALNLEQVFRNIETTVEISVFLNDNADVEGMRQSLDEHDDVLSYIFVSKDEGLKEFGEAMGNIQILADLTGENNPLPDVFRVKARRAEVVSALASEIQAHPGVEMVDYGRETLSRLLTATDWIRTFVVGTSIILAIGAIFLIVTIIRMSVMARQEEIGIMKYLGAANWFVRFPFVVGGMIIGWFGTIVAIATIGIGYFHIAEGLQREALAFFLQPVLDLSKIIPIFVNLMLIGTLVGGLGSFISVRKYLKV
jgi:cell division transport system permease protein